MTRHRGLKVQEHECGKRLATREARFGAKIALVKEDVFPSDLTVPYKGWRMAVSLRL